MAKMFNCGKNSVKLALYSPVTDMAGHGDVSIQTTRQVVTADPVVMPPNAATVVPDSFWQSWTQANASSSLLVNQVLFPVP
jgi:hypothetical protein